MTERDAAEIAELLKIGFQLFYVTRGDDGHVICEEYRCGCGCDDSWVVFWSNGAPAVYGPGIIQEK